MTSFEALPEDFRASAPVQYHFILKNTITLPEAREVAAKQYQVERDRKTGRKKKSRTKHDRDILTVLPLPKEAVELEIKGTAETFYCFCYKPDAAFAFRPNKEGEGLHSELIGDRFTAYFAASGHLAFFKRHRDKKARQQRTVVVPADGQRSQFGMK
jgi:hypothetical protein